MPSKNTPAQILHGYGAHLTGYDLAPPIELETALAQLDTYYREKYEAEKDRFCGVCYKPSIERGGWWCPSHEYKSVYISKKEATKLRSMLKEENHAK